jgi:hypothetical protein
MAFFFSCLNYLCREFHYEIISIICIVSWVGSFPQFFSFPYISLLANSKYINFPIYTVSCNFIEFAWAKFFGGIFMVFYILGQLFRKEKQCHSYLSKKMTLTYLSFLIVVTRTSSKMSKGSSKSLPLLFILKENLYFLTEAM